MKLTETLRMATRDGCELTARRLTAQDGRALQEFNRGLKPETERLFRAHSYDDDTVGKALQRSEAGEDLTLGVFDGERLVGYFFLWYFRDPLPLLGVGLQDDYQDRGLGRQMVALLIEEAKAAGKEGLELTTNTDNERAFALYRTLGFLYVKDVPNLQGDGSVVTERAMFYPIKPGATPPDREHRPPV